MLTPAYQDASGSFGSYNGVLEQDRVGHAEQRHRRPVGDDGDLRRRLRAHKGGRTTEHHTLQLVHDGSSYLINDQLS